MRVGAHQPVGGRDPRLGERIGRRLGPGDVVALSGELGAGKTQLVRGICRGAGVPDGEVSSPTFAIVATYRGRLPVNHADLYRIGDEDELHATGFHDLVGRCRGDRGGVGRPLPGRAPGRAAGDPALPRGRAPLGAPPGHRRGSGSGTPGWPGRWPRGLPGLADPERERRREHPQGSVHADEAALRDHLPARPADGLAGHREDAARSGAGSRRGAACRGGRRRAAVRRRPGS